MLHFILGRAATGRTYLTMQKIKEDALSGKEVVLLVPEQFSFESERAVLRALGDMSATRVAVLSFSRICDEVNRLAGGSAFTVMSDCDKIITMRLALKTVANELKIWGRYVDSPRFASTMVETIDEFKTCAVSPEQLSEISVESSLGKKLEDIKKIYNAYEALIYNRFIDPTDSLTYLYNKLGDYQYFKNKEVYIDSFKDFTGQQYKILERIISQANNITVSLLSDGTEADKPDIFSNIRKVRSKLSSIATKYAVNSSELIFLKESRYSSVELKALEKSFCGEVKTYQGKTEDITVYCANDVFAEADFVARNIRRLVRTKGYRYRDFVIIARDTADYENAVLSACRKNNVSCFFDEKQTIENQPICIFSTSALSASHKISTKDMFSFLKTDLSPLSYSQVNELENYVNIWNIDGALWFDEWSMNPFGFQNEEGNSEKINKKLEEINLIRRTAIAPIVNLKNNFGETAKDHASALMALIEECGVREKLRNTEDEETDLASVFELTRQCFDKYMDILDSIVKCLGDTTISFKDFIDTLKLAIRSTTVGTIPQMLDQVTFGAADRIRPSRPKIAFVMGMNQGIFPKTVSSGGVFAAHERRLLIELGVEINDNTLQQAITENLLVYTSLCCASDKLFISYRTGGISGENAEPSSVVKKIKNHFPEISYQYSTPDFVDASNIPETQAALFSDYCTLLSDGSDYADVIKEALDDAPELSNKIEKLEKQISANEPSLSPEVAERLYGNTIKTSATDFEIFHRCKFSYFCRYGLRLKKLQPASLDVMQRGTVVHYALEKYILRYSKSLESLSDEEITEIITKLINEYFSLIPGIEQIKTARFNFLINIITDSVCAVAKQVTKELAQSSFVPEKCELSIGNDGDVPAVDIKIDDTLLMKLQGKIDRVDVWNGYVRIVDYKTGAKAFKLPDVLYGLNLQMLIYLYALLCGDSSDYQGMEPAGILYMPSSKKLGKDDLCMNGILLKNEDVMKAMEKNNNGQFVPKMKFNKDGSIADTDSYVDNEIFTTVFDYITYLFREMGEDIRKGNISVSPVDDGAKNACTYCDFGPICRVEDSPHCMVDYISKDEVMTKMKGCVNGGV